MVAEYLAGQVEMSRERKLTKYVLSIALQTSNSVAGAARYLGVNRRTVQRSIKQFGLDKVAPKARIDAHLEGSATLSQSVSANQAATLKAPANPSVATEKLERNVCVLTASDFSGACRGDVRSAGIATSIDGQLARYRSLKDY
jgi:hypothetical protein